MYKNINSQARWQNMFCWMFIEFGYRTILLSCSIWQLLTNFKAKADMCCHLTAILVVKARHDLLYFNTRWGCIISLSSLSITLNTVLPAWKNFHRPGAFLSFLLFLSLKNDFYKKYTFFLFLPWRQKYYYYLYLL